MDSGDEDLKEPRRRAIGEPHARRHRPARPLAPLFSVSKGGVSWRCPGDGSKWSIWWVFGSSARRDRGQKGPASESECSNGTKK